MRTKSFADLTFFVILIFWGSTSICLAENNVKLKSKLNPNNTLKYNQLVSIRKKIKSKNKLTQSTNAFKNITKSVGIHWNEDNVFSIAWVDFNNDGYEDLWISPHFYYKNNVSLKQEKRLPRLLLNQGGKKFIDVSKSILPSPSLLNRTDSHGTSWADFDNDGDPDVLVSVGAEGGTGSGENLLLINEGGHLIKSDGARGLSYDTSRGRSSLWLDINGDGLLDALMLVARRPDGQSPTTLFQQDSSGQFHDVGSTVGIQVPEAARSAQLADITGDGRLDLVIQGMYEYPLRVYDLSTMPVQDVTSLLPSIKSCPNNNCMAQLDQADTNAPRDAAIADFNGDLRSDIFTPRSLVETQKSILYLDKSKKLIEAVLKPYKKEEGFSFVLNGPISFNSLGNKKGSQSPELSEIYIGSNGINPIQVPFILDPTNPDSIGIKDHIPGSDSGIYIGYDDASQTWKILYSNSRKGDKYNYPVIVDSSLQISGLKLINFKPPNRLNNALQPQILLYDNGLGQYVSGTNSSGFSKPILGQYVVAGDFDNDMDIDLYVSCSYSNFDVNNVFYRNQGDGTFVDDTLASGLGELVQGPHKFNFSLGQKLAVADYDNDGFLDIFSSPTTFDAFGKNYLGASQKLFHNLGNGNHWIEINLKGTVSNRDAIGARIIATTNGISQLREQGGGMHQFAQNQKRIHFGLAGNTTIDKLEIFWPSGIVQTLTDVAVDQILTIEETPA